MHTVYQLPPGVMNAMIARVKLLGRMDVVEKRRPLDGRIKTRNPDGDEVEMRLSTLPDRVRREDGDAHLRSPTHGQAARQLGFGSHDAKRWEELVARPHGIILVTGPDRLGQDDHAVLDAARLATDEVNVCTIEDPIEMIQPAFNQTQVQPAARPRLRRRPARADAPGPGHHHGRRDPRPRDAEMAIQAALTGHLVFSTLHTNDSRLGDHAAGRPGRAAVPDRRDRDRRAGAAPGAHAVRELQAARRSDHAETLDESSSRGASTAASAVQAGRLPRMPHDRLSAAARPVRAADRERAAQACITRARRATLRQQALKDGLRPLRLAGAMKVAEGVTTLDEVLRATPAWE
jgi:general secretion pathway protein E